MSIVNLHLRRDRAWICWDTLVTMGGKPHRFSSKGSLFPHILTVAGFRGLVELQNVFEWAINGRGPHVITSIEDVILMLPDHLNLWRDGFRKERPDALEQIKGELFLLGWLPTTQEFAGWHLSSNNDFAPVKLPMPYTMINPGASDAGYQPPPTINDPYLLVKCCEAQKQMAEANIAAGGDALGIGGEVILAMLDRHGIQIKKAHRFPDFQATKEAIRNAG